MKAAKAAVAQLGAGSAFAAGLLFAVGLGIAGMTQPAKVESFLDVGGAWDPSLAFVMGGAIAVHATSLWVWRRRSRPFLAPAFRGPQRRGPDARLVVGAALFGVGWGLSGFCPGPALVSLAVLTPAALVFAPAMLAGIGLFWVLGRLRRSAATKAAGAAPQPRPSIV